MIDDNDDDIYLTAWLLGSSARIITNIISWHAYRIKYTHNCDGGIKVCPEMRISDKQDTVEMQDGHCYELQLKEIIYPVLVQTLPVCRTNYRLSFASMPVGGRKIRRKFQIVKNPRSLLRVAAANVLLINQYLL